MFGIVPMISTSNVSTSVPRKVVKPIPFIPARTSRNGRIGGGAASTVGPLSATASAAARSLLIGSFSFRLGRISREKSRS